jgi:uncharacterized protein YijF (DUF1287 family)
LIPYASHKAACAALFLFIVLEGTLPAQAVPLSGAKIAAAAKAQIGETVRYDPAYVKLTYPGGDVPRDRGVCTDVVIRAFRANGLDLQKVVHEDMAANFRLYPKLWGLPGPDASIDHRRVPNLMTYFKRFHTALPLSKAGSDYQAGDIVAWNLPGGLKHIGVVAGEWNVLRTAPLVVHNIGSGAQEEDVLFAFEIIGHYRAD